MLIGLFNPCFLARVTHAIGLASRPQVVSPGACNCVPECPGCQDWWYSSSPDPIPISHPTFSGAADGPGYRWSHRSSLSVCDMSGAQVGVYLSLGGLEHVLWLHGVNVLLIRIHWHTHVPQSEEYAYAFAHTCKHIHMFCHDICIRTHTSAWSGTCAGLCKWWDRFQFVPQSLWLSL